jgi:hypothetical protein
MCVVVEVLWIFVFYIFYWKIYQLKERGEEREGRGKMEDTERKRGKIMIIIQSLTNMGV